MNREQAINYLFSSGFTNEQICEVVRALTYEPTTKNDPKFCPDRKAKTAHMETILHCIENECAAYKDGKCLKYNSDQEPTTKNDLPHCQHTDEEIAKSFIEDVEAIKDHLPCGEMMDFPNTFDEFAEDYGFKDEKEIYTNGSELIPVFRVKQWLEHISTTKNDLGVDCISRDEVCRYVAEFVNHEFSTREEEELIDNIITGIEHIPSVTPQEPRKGHWIESMPGGAEEWCYKCSECNFWKYKKTINLSKFKFCPNCGADMREVEE